MTVSLGDGIMKRITTYLDLVGREKCWIIKVTALSVSERLCYAERFKIAGHEEVPRQASVMRK
jgi:hypothetical protein